MKISNELLEGKTPISKLHLMQALRIKINGVDHLFFGPVISDPETFNVQEIEDFGPLPMASVSDLLDRVQAGEDLYGHVQ